VTQQAHTDVSRQQQMETAAQQDPLLRLLLDLGRDRQRLRQVKKTTAEQVMVELNETLAAYTEETLGFVVQLRNWISESLADVDARLNDVEAGVGGLDPDLVDKIVRICGECSALAKATLDKVEDEPGKKALTELVSLCEEVLDDLGDEDEEDAVDVDDEESESPEA